MRLQIVALLADVADAEYHQRQVMEQPMQHQCGRIEIGNWFHELR